MYYKSQKKEIKKELHKTTQEMDNEMYKYNVKEEGGDDA